MPYKHIYEVASFADHIYIPQKGGAMENWGIITYSRSTLLLDPDYTYDEEFAVSIYCKNVSINYYL